MVCHWITNLVTELMLYPNGLKIKGGTESWISYLDSQLGLICVLGCVTNKTTFILLSLTFHIWPAIQHELLLMEFIFHNAFAFLGLVHVIGIFLGGWQLFFFLFWLYSWFWSAPKNYIWFLVFWEFVVYIYLYFYGKWNQNQDLKCNQTRTGKTETI